MELKEAERLANFLVDAWGLSNEGWVFKWDHAKRRFGQCSYHTKTISLSRYLVELNDRPDVEDTILHEIAHALAGGRAGHGPEWKRECRRVGAKPKACYKTSEIQAPPPNYVGICPHCMKVREKRYRMKTMTYTLACGPCCDNFNDGKWTRDFALQWSAVEKSKPQPKKKAWDDIPPIESLA